MKIKHFTFVVILMSPYIKDIRLYVKMSMYPESSLN
jgi:hypothetical protein